MAMDPAIVQSLCNRLSEERHAQIQSLRLLAAAAIAAAGQVRDTRLDRLENPAPPEEPGLLFDLFIELAITPGISAISGAALKAVKAVTRRFVISRRGFDLGLSKIGRPPKKAAVPSSIGGLKKARKSVPVVTEEGEEFEKWMFGFAKATSGFFEKKGVKAFRDWATKDPRALRPTPPLEADSPASMIEEDVLHSCALQEASINVVMDGYVNSVRSPSFTAAEAIELDELLTYLAETPIIDARESRCLRLFFESCIWCLMFPEVSREAVITSTTIGSVRYGIESGRSSAKYNRLLIDGNLAHYLVNRLPHPEGDGFQAFVAVKGGPRQEGTLDLRLRSWVDREDHKLTGPIATEERALAELSMHFGSLHEVATKYHETLEGMEPMIYSSQRPASPRAPASTRPTNPNKRSE